MTKVIKGEFEKLKDLNNKDVSLACDTSLEVFNKEFNRMSGIDDDLLKYQVKVVNIPCDSNKDDDSEQRMSHEADDDIGYDPSNVAFTEWLGSNFFNYKTMDHYTKKALWIYWTRGDDKVELTNEEFSDNEDEVAELSWKGQSVMTNQVMMVGEDGKAMRLPTTITIRMKLMMKCEAHELQVCNIRRFKMIKYSFGQDEEYVVVKEDEYDDLAKTSDDACRAYQEIFRKMGEGWMVTRAE
ncbi:hypothetical protein Tco_0323158 [Tanacetum coccineum]